MSYISLIQKRQYRNLSIRLADLSWFGLRKVLLYLLLILAILWSVLPLLWMFLSSVKSDAETFNPNSGILPEALSFENYQTLFTVTKFSTWMLNSTLMAASTTLGVVLLASAVAYALTRFKYPGFEFFSRMSLVAYMMPPIILIVPLFLLMFRLNLVDSLFGLWLVYLATRLPFGIWLLRSYFAGIPIEMEEAALIDGATRFQAFHRVILPQALPGLISTALFVFSVTWHEFLFASLLIFSSSSQTLSSGIASFLSEDWIYSWGVVMAAGVMVSLPLVIFYMFLQRYLVAGLGSGSLKG